MSNDGGDYPDPIAVPLPKTRLPRWVWWALVPVALCALLALGALVFGFVAAYRTIDSGCDHETYPPPSEADCAALMSVADLPAHLDLDPARESVEKTHYENCTLGLDYGYLDDEVYLYSSIDEEASVVDAIGTFRALLVDDDPQYEVHADLFRWGDASSFAVYTPDGEPCGYWFLGRRGTRVVWVEWGSGAYEILSPDELDAFLTPIVERMATYELVP